jgi:DNA-binding transcriptional LysR family regulator
MHRLDDVVIFTRIVEHRSISRAAQLLHMSPSAVSRRLSRLEEDLKIRLFNRSTHHLSLTEGGNIFYDHCIKGLLEIERGVSSAEAAVEKISGTLRVHASQGVGESLVAPAIIEFVKQYNDTSVELEINEAPVNLLERKFDVSIRGKNFTDEGLDGVSSLSCVELLKAPYAICASPDYLARGRPLRHPSDLKMHNCLIHTAQLMPNEWWFTEGKKKLQGQGARQFHHEQRERDL